jgi:hypothetical protein
VRLKANISRDRRRFEDRSVVSQGKSPWIMGNARFTALPQETVLKGGSGQSPPVSKTRHPNAFPTGASRKSLTRTEWS